MRGVEFRVRDKKVQKMTKDGLVERNLTRNTERSVSSREADVSFGRTDAGRQVQDAEIRGIGSKKPHQSGGQKPGILHQIQAEQGERFSGASAPEVWQPVHAPASMRDAGDGPMEGRYAGGNGGNHAPGHKDSGGMQRNTDGSLPQNTDKAQEFTAGPSVQEQGERQEENGEGDSLDAGNKAYHARPAKKGRLDFGNAAGKTKRQKKGRQYGKSRKSAQETAESSFEKESKKQGGADGRDDSRRNRLQFGHEEKPDQKADAGRRAALKKLQAVKFAAEMAEEKNGGHGTKRQGNGTAQKSRLRFEDTKDRPGDGRLQYSRSGKSPGECAAAAKDGVDGKAADGKPGSRDRKLENAGKHARKAGRKLERAQGKLPEQRKAHLEKQYDSASGKVKRRLRFEKDVIPEGERPSAAKRAGTGIAGAAYMAAAAGAGRKMQEAVQDNTAVEAAYRGGNVAGRTASGTMRRAKGRRSEKAYRAVRRAKREAAKAEAGLEYRKILAEDPDRKKKAFAKWVQKKRIQKGYAAAARESAKGAKRAGNVLDAAGRAVRSAVRAVVSNKGVIAVLIIILLLFGLSASLFSSCSAMLTGVQSALLSTCYTADSTEIDAAELRYTEMEADLQIDISGTEGSYPGYDEYRYNIAEIGHNPFELMGYLSAAYGSFTYAEVKPEVERLFGLQYALAREEVTETRTYIDGEGVEQEYEWHVLKTTLTVTQLSEIIAGALSGEAADLYGVFMQTCGNRQCFANPVGFAWIPYVAGPYGYRAAPDGTKEMHYGVDIGAAYGSPIYAVQDGRVASAGNSGDMGLCIVIEDMEGYSSVYARCATVSVSAGQEVKRGDVIGTVGNAGGTEAYLHLEVKYGSGYLNPYYFVANGGSGYAPGGGAAGVPDIPDDPGGEMGDGSFAAMLAEAEKYIGFPYVWGGSSPSTSFDCSGFVSWVINQSGVGSVGRQTAQGLYNLCTPVSKADMKPGDLIFFTGTYSTANPVTHVGIYVGNGRMIHCGNPIGYADISTPYWTAHFYSGGRLP